jgi:LmbE family N-acetylglucosaminyl deacetylase
LSIQNSRVNRFLNHLTLEDQKARFLLDSKKIISFSPHPDDSELIAGGFLASAVERGAEVKLVVVSDDRMSFTSIENELPMEKIVAIRKEEELKAIEILGVRDVEFLEYADSRVPEPETLMNDFLRVIRDYAPDLVISVDPFLPYEAHPDHLNTGHAMLRAVLFHQFPYVLKSAVVKSGPPNIALGASASPNVIVPIDAFMDKKVRSILSHKSQFPNTEDIERKIRDMASVLGKLINCRYGEAFKVLLPDEIHVDVLASY